MLAHEKGTVSGSEEFHLNPSEMAKQLLYHVTDCGVYFCDLGYRVDRDNYGNFLMLYVTKGVLAVSTEGNTYLVKEGQSAFFNCHTHHTYYAKGFVSFYWIHFDGANTSDLYREYVKRRNGIVFIGKHTENLRKDISHIVSCYQNHIPPNEPKYSSILYRCLMTLLFADNKSVKEEENSVVEQAKRYIQGNISEDLTLHTAAEHVGLSSSHFSRLFKKETGYSPYEYIILVRINKAKHLLKTTDMPVKEIAYEVGYNSESNFCNAFTQRIGLSPVNFKKL